MAWATGWAEPRDRAGPRLSKEVHTEVRVGSPEGTPSGPAVGSKVPSCCLHQKIAPGSPRPGGASAAVSCGAPKPRASLDAGPGFCGRAAEP